MKVVCKRVNEVPRNWQKTDPNGSLTVPSLARTTREELERGTRGMAVEQLIGFYSSEYGIEVPEFEKMTKLERLNWSIQNKQKVAKIYQRIKTEAEEFEKKNNISKSKKVNNDKDKDENKDD